MVLSGKFGLVSGKSQGILFCPVCMNPALEFCDHSISPGPFWRFSLKFNIPAWCMKPLEILFDLHSRKKSESNPHILKDDFRKMQSHYKIYQQIYTDGSKEDSKVGCAVISDNHSNMQRIPDDSSIFTAEAKLIDLALDFISTCDANNKFIIFSDSLSVLKAMNHTSSKNPQIQKL